MVAEVFVILRKFGVRLRVMSEVVLNTPQMIAIKKREAIHDHS